MTVESRRTYINEALRNEVFDRDDNRCVKCGNTSNLQVDHIIPFQDGGKTVKENLQTLCRKCNIEKRGEGSNTKIQYKYNPQHGNTKKYTPEELENNIEAYFNDPNCDYTRTGLVMACDLNHETFDMYARDKAYSDIIKKGKLLVERAYEARLQSTTPTGAIFALKNMAWSDRQDLNVGQVELKIIKDR